MFGQGQNGGRGKKRIQQGRGLRMERMEERQMMAADIYFEPINDVLYIEGTNEDDQIVVEGHSNNQIRATIYDKNGSVRKDSAGNEFREVFYRDDIQSLMIVADGGSDTVRNHTSIPMTALGGSGNDNIMGGYAKDIIFGESGDDEIRGRHGDDIIYGGNNNDKLSGDEGDDTIYGEHGRDVLNGGADNDNLYGGDDYDRLYGEGGNDGLFGGDDFDRLYAGTGYDRILKDYRDNDRVYNTSSNDAVIHFKDGSTETYSQGPIDRYYTERAWTDSEIMAVDEAFDRLHDLTSNTRLLKLHDGRGMVFHRVGNWEGASDGSNNGEFSGGWNSGDGNIYLTQWAWDNGVVSLEQTVIHEIAHNWDSPEENPGVEKFRSESGWEYHNNASAAFHAQRGDYLWKTLEVGGGDDGWWHKRDAENFVSNYSKYNATEDFAETFTAYVMGDDYVGLDENFNETGGIDEAPGKKKYMRDFIKSLA